MVRLDEAGGRRLGVEAWLVAWEDRSVIWAFEGRFRVEEDLLW